VKHRVRVVAYVTRGDELLVFEYADENDPPGVQVPAGGVDSDERLDLAALREVEEETGITDARLVRKLGVSDFVAEGWQHEQHFFQLEAPLGLPDEWEHVGTGGGEDDGHVFRCRFVPRSKSGLDEAQYVFLNDL
jgi:8-oxo-dGTP pyrophosphatase MutT (NUDIX family)